MFRAIKSRPKAATRTIVATGWLFTVLAVLAPGCGSGAANAAAGRHVALRHTVPPDAGAHTRITRQAARTGDRPKTAIGFEESPTFLARGGAYRRSQAFLSPAVVVRPLVRSSSAAFNALVVRFVGIEAAADPAWKVGLHEIGIAL